MPDAETKKFVRCVRTLPLYFKPKTAEFTYDNPVSVLVDATLSINRNYKRFVVPRVKLVKQSGLVNFPDLKKQLKRGGESDFCLLWDYNDTTRVRLLERLVDKFLEIKAGFGINNDLQVLRKWGRQTVAEDYVEFNVAGIGFTTFQYLRMLCGSDTAKPDIHIIRAVRECLGESLSLIDTVKLLEHAAKELGVRAQRLDYALWDFYSKR